MIGISKSSMNCTICKTNSLQSERNNGDILSINAPIDNYNDLLKNLVNQN